ncbi:DEAD/DEAH box helicase [Aquibacillus sp. 3ASR75-11]|uniref:DEAD/DEAH box helicase n=1 Tax=Terrihalobacillus insolitus TaxID=2950438 RepID=A0A9X4AM22_9BACI|nr:DEAD/DEAH box helicase [Terrihalobacillus insolitus]MDC3412251.1 DEAD/DEAH box helicase [Terrihalobacillus insolitus]MDC3423055.1 DEAD/DEAH box helicase [Terrihalobacillus insolitus]
MRTFFINKQDIVKITGERFYKRGLNYFRNGRVYGLQYNPAINYWSAQVKGTGNYTVRIFFFDNDELEANCNCPAYHTHFTCKHIAAVLLAVNDQSYSQVKKDANDTEHLMDKRELRDDSFSSRLIDVFGQQKQTLVKKASELTVTYEVRTHVNYSKSMLKINLKIGTKKGYAVRNLKDLLHHIQQNKAYQVSSNFRYDPTIHVFSDRNKEILHMLQLMRNNEAMYTSSFGGDIQEKNSLIIPTFLAHDLLQAIAEQHGTYCNETKQSGPLKINTAGDLPLTFKVSTDPDGAFQFDSSDLFQAKYLESYGYLIKDGTFYKLNENQQEITEKLYTLLPYRSDVSHQVPKEKIEPFLTNVISKLEEVGTVSYTEEARSKVTVAPLNAKVYLDEEKDGITAKVTFHYGDRLAYPYQEVSSYDNPIKRDDYKENEVLNLLESIHFVFINGEFRLFQLEFIYSFLHDILPKLEQKADVYISTAVKSMLTSKPTFTSTVQLDGENGMLDIEFDMEGISSKDVQHVLQALVEKKQYYRIPNGALLDLEDANFHSFQELAEQLHLKKGQLKDGHIEVSLARSLQIEETLGKDRAQYGEAFQQLLDRLKNPSKETFPLPKGLQADLRPYQYTGFQWLKMLASYRLGGILADDMGLGKTIQTITYLLSEKETKPNVRSSIVVAPASLIYNWKKEFEKFSPSLKVTVIAGSKEQRAFQIEQATDTDVFVTSYPLLRKDIDIYKELTFDSIVLDEAQAIKNHLTLTAKATRNIRANKRFALSGTPIENSLDELWSIFHTISPGLFTNQKEFSQLDHSYIAKVTRPFILRRIKREVLQDLPDKIESVHYSELTKNQKELYLAYLERMQAQMDNTIEEKGFAKGKLEILAGLTRLRQICCHPSLFLDSYNGKSGKLEQLLALVQTFTSSGNRMLIFSQFSSMLKLINQVLHENGIESYLLDGSTPSEDRVDMTESFNDGNKSVFLISLKAGGTGLNLTGADTVILYDLWWNPAVEEQAAGRAHRIGQKKVVQIIRLITEGTIEEKIFELQQKKRELVDQIIQPGETMLSKLTEEELRELLQMKA